MSLVATERPEKHTLDSAIEANPITLNALVLLQDMATPPQIGTRVKIVSIEGRSLRNTAPNMVVVSDSMALTVSVNEAGTTKDMQNIAHQRMDTDWLVETERALPYSMARLIKTKPDAYNPAVKMVILAASESRTRRCPVLYKYAKANALDMPNCIVLSMNVCGRATIMSLLVVTVPMPMKYHNNMHKIVVRKFE